MSRGPRTKSTVSTRTRETFLRHFAETGNVTLAAKLTGITREIPYRWRNKSPTFAKAWDDAGEAATDALEAEARRRAVEGYQEPVYQQGQLVGYVTRYSDKLLETLLRGNREKYRQGVADVPTARVMLQVDFSRPAPREIDVTPELVSIEAEQPRAMLAREPSSARGEPDDLPPSAVKGPRHG